MGLVQVVDVGTTNVKSGVVDKEGNLVAHESEGLELKRPEPGAAEHDPEELLRTFRRVARRTSEGFGTEIDYLVLSGYLFGFLPLDENKEPLTGMITLLDKRPKSVMDEVKGRFPVDGLYRLTGCPPLSIYSFAKILWLQEEKPELYRRTEYFADLKSFLVQELTGEFVTETSTASATQLYNVDEGTWDGEVLDWLGVEEGSLPELKAGSDPITSLDGKVAEGLGLEGDTVLLPGLYDGGAMILGMGGYGSEEAICNLGTTAMLRKCSSSPIMDAPESRRLQTYQLLPGSWVVGGSLNNAGIALQWFRENFSPERSYDQIVRAAEEVEPGSDGLLFLPFLTGERDPRMGDLSSGVFFGLKPHHSEEHMVRAILEGVIYALDLVFGVMKDKGISVTELVIGGSGSKGTLWPRIAADVLEVPVRKSITEDATLIGGALLAYREGGVYSDYEEATESMVSKGEKFTPRERHFSKYRKAREFFGKLVETTRPLFEEHSRTFLEQ